MRGGILLKRSLAVVAVLVAGLVPVHPASAQLSLPQTWGKKTEQVQFYVDVDLRDQGTWDIKDDGECTYTEASGEQIITSSSWEFGPTPTTHRGKGNVVNVTRYSKGNWQLTGYQTTWNALPADIVQPALLNVENRTNEKDKGCPPNEQTVCPGCGEAAPPREECGRVAGNLTVRGLISNFGSGSVNATLLNASLSPEEAFPENDRTFCNNNALEPWPNILALRDAGGHFNLKKSKAFRYFALGSKARRQCQRRSPEFARTPKEQASQKCAANFVVKVKKLLTEHTPAPYESSKRQESVLTLRFWFRGACKGSTCFVKNPGWEKVPKLPGVADF